MRLNRDKELRECNDKIESQGRGQAIEKQGRG
jgi:hypothetical protein